MRTTEATAMLEHLAAQGHLIGDGWRQSAADGQHSHVYPATGLPQAVVGLGGAEDIDDAVRAARQAQPEWAALPKTKRAGVLRALGDLLEVHAASSAELAALDNGTPINVIKPGRYAAEWVRYYAQWATDLETHEPVTSDDVSVIYEPVGVVGAIPPWNGSMMGLAQKCAPALAAGNAVVAKPPEIAPFGMLRFAELALEAGLPPGVLNVVVGGASTGSALVSHSGLDKVTFTGGTATGRQVMAACAATLTPVVLELGGKSPNIVFPDADLDAAATMAALAGTALLSGQGCALPTRLYVHDSIYDEMTHRVLATLETLRVGDPLDPATFIGPVVTVQAMERILGLIERAVGDGAEVLVGGGRLGGDLAHGFFVAPTVLGDVDHTSEIARTEVFGPVQSIIRFSGDDEVLTMANDTPFGLNAYIHTHDPARIERFVRELDVGTVAVNGMGRTTPATPFGGTKDSGFGREGGRAGIVEMVRTKTVLTRKDR